MKVSVSEAKQRLHALLRAVRRVDQLPINRRGRPFARVDPIEPPAQDEQIASLIARGVILPPKCKLDVEEFLNEELPKLPPDRTLSDVVISERAEGL